MKKILFLLSVVAFMGQINSQTYFPFPDSSATWTVLYEYQSSPTNYYSQIYNYSMLGDTVFHSVNYKKIYRDGVYFGSIRQDTLQRSIYFHGDYNSNHADDTLLYQFGLHVGDSIQIKFPVSNTQHISSIDSVSIGGQYRKKYNNYGANTGADEWIEGVGSTHFLFLPFDYEFEWHWTLICHTANGTQLYERDYSIYPSSTLKNGCTGQILEVNEKEGSHSVMIFPNPASDQFFLDANTADKVNLDFYDVNGRHVLSTSVSDKSYINVPTLDNGVYTLSVKTEGRVQNKKLVIIH